MRFDSYHPTINFIYFVAAIICTLRFNHPIFLAISFGCAFLYSVKLNGRKSLVLNSGLIVLAVAYTAWYSFYHHFGVTNLRTNFIGNQITLESIVYGFVRGMTVITVIMWFCCIFRLVTSDKIVYLFGRISPNLSLFLSILLRIVPRIGERARRIERSREGIGRGIHQGNVFQRLRNACMVLSILITWTLEAFVESTVSMKSRGYSLKGRTAFSVYRFDNRDRSLVIVFFGCLTLIMMAVMLNQTSIYYDPMIVMNPITVMSYVFYGIYAFFLLLPMGLQVIGERQFEKMRASV